MTLQDLLMCIFGLAMGTFFLLMSREGPRSVTPELKQRILRKGRIVECDDRAFTVEYEHADEVFYYTMLRRHFFDRYGYTPETKFNDEDYIYMIRGRDEINKFLEKGYSYDYYFRIEKGAQVKLWIDEMKPEIVYRVWKNDDKANRSVNRAFRLVGLCFIIPTLLIMYSKLR